jgi:hypothetical protein
MKCNWCGEGKGMNFTTDKEGRIYYYYCQECVGDFKSKCPFCHAEFVTFQTKDMINK